jgi:hypothetical protein
MPGLPPYKQYDGTPNPTQQYAYHPLAQYMRSLGCTQKDTAGLLEKPSDMLLH